MKTKGLIPTLFALLASLSSQAGIPLKNGDFESGLVPPWDGNGRIVVLKNGNHVYQLRAIEGQRAHVSVPIVFSDSREVRVQFKARALQDYEGPGFGILWRNPGVGALRSNRKLVSTGEWQNYNARYVRKATLDDRVFCIMIDQGRGTVEVDDFQFEFVGIGFAPDATTPEKQPLATPNRNSLPWSLSVPGGTGQLKRTQASIHALLVRSLDSGGHAAQATELSVTAVPSTDSGNLLFSFNQPIGSDMRTAFEEVVRGFQIKHPKIPNSTKITFGFEDKWRGKDGRSASVAGALLLESLVTGFEIPNDLAVTGDMNADLTVQPVGAISDKVRGAIEAGCVVIAVPASNESDLDDLFVEEGLASFLRASVFLLRKLDDAILLANPESPTAEFNRTISDFHALQRTLLTNGPELFTSTETQDRLRRIINAVPDLYSAKILLLASLKKAPTRFSLVGSLNRISNSRVPYLETIREALDMTSFEEIRAWLKAQRVNPLIQARNQIAGLKPRSDPRLADLIQAEELVIVQFRRLVDPTATASHDALQKELNAAFTRRDEQWRNFLNDRQIQDQLLRRHVDPGS